MADAWNEGAKWVVGWVQTLEADGGEWPQLPDPIGLPSRLVRPQPDPAAGQLLGRRRSGRSWATSARSSATASTTNTGCASGSRPALSPPIVHRRLGSYRLHQGSKTVCEWDAFEPEFARVRAEYLPLLSAKGRNGPPAASAARRSGSEALRPRLGGAEGTDVAAARKHAKAALRKRQVCRGVVAADVLCGAGGDDVLVNQPMTRLSILLPMRNAKPYMARHLASLLAQEGLAGDRDEVIVIDDGSTDASRSIVEQISRRALGIGPRHRRSEQGHFGSDERRHRRRHR